MPQVPDEAPEYVYTNYSSQKTRLPVPSVRRMSLDTKTVSPHYVCGDELQDLKVASMRSHKLNINVFLSPPGWRFGGGG